MKIKNRRQKNKKIIITVILTTLILLIGLAFYFWQQSINRPKTTIQTEVEKTISPTKESTLASPSVDPRTNDQVNTTISGSIEINDLKQLDGTVSVSATVTNFNVKKCVYQFRSDGAKPVLREVASKCGVVTINEQEFDKPGTYTLTVTSYSEQDKLTASKEVLIQ